MPRASPPLCFGRRLWEGRGRRGLGTRCGVPYLRSTATVWVPVGIQRSRASPPHPHPHVNMPMAAHGRALEVMSAGVLAGPWGVVLKNSWVCAPMPCVSSLATSALVQRPGGHGAGHSLEAVPQ